MSWYPLILISSVSIKLMVCGVGALSTTGGGAGELAGLGVRSRRTGKRSKRDVTRSSRSMSASRSAAGL